MANQYLDYLDQRAAQRRLAAKFAQPKLLLLHTVAFVGAVTALFGVITPLLRWVPLGTFNAPAFGFFLWTLVLAGHALWHYRRSSAISEKRELVVEEAMRGLIAKSDQPLDDEALFAMHDRLNGSLERQGWLAQGLTTFALVNAVSWLGVALNLGTSWGFQLTLPMALVLVGGVYGFRAWQQNRRNGGGWLGRLPLHHIVIYGVGAFLLGLAGILRMINSWDADTLIGLWAGVLVIHILVAVFAKPLLARFFSEGTGKSTGKRKVSAEKPNERLMLSDDGEILDLLERPDDAHSRKAASRL